VAWSGERGRELRDGRRRWGWVDSRARQQHQTSGLCSDLFHVAQCSFSCQNWPASHILVASAMTVPGMDDEDDDDEEEFVYVVDERSV
jgi:hypothetical protein